MNAKRNGKVNKPTNKDGIITIIMLSLEHLRVRRKRVGDLSANFDRKEFACKCGCGFATVDVDLIAILETIRCRYRKPVTVTSACRCDEHNENIGGSYGSKHKQGIAADIVVQDVEPAVIYAYLDDMFPMNCGLGKYETFTHVDVREQKARWKG